MRTVRCSIRFSKPGGTAIIPFDSLRARIEEELRKAEELKLYKAWIERLKRKFYVKILADDKSSEPRIQ